MDLARDLVGAYNLRLGDPATLIALMTGGEEVIMTNKTVPTEIRKMSFEDALHELETIVDSLEQGDGKLDEAIGAYERGTLLKQHCEIMLKEARERIEKINIGPHGDVSAAPAEIE